MKCIWAVCLMMSVFPRINAFSMQFPTEKQSLKNGQPKYWSEEEVNNLVDEIVEEAGTIMEDTAIRTAETVREEEQKKLERVCQELSNEAERKQKVMSALCFTECGIIIGLLGIIAGGVLIYQH